MILLFRGILITLCTITLSIGQPVETGLPFITNFTPKEYNANTQNWSIIEDQRGVMYFGNNKGVLEYDGVSWRLIPVKNRSIVRSLAINDDGVIFVGAVGEFGYLAPDESGDMVYHSLTHLLPDQASTFSDIWTTLVRDDEVYFQSFNVLFRYKDGTIKSWPLQNGYHRSFLINNNIYFRQDSVGLTTLSGDSLRPVKGGALFAKEFASVMLPFDDDILIGSRNQGLFLYNPESGTMQKFKTEVDDLLSESKIYHGTILNNGNIALGTLKEGLVVISKEGKLLLHLDETKGLQYQIVYNLFSDSYGSLWMALANGISKVEVISPFTIFDQVSGLNGGILAINRHEGKLYVSTHQSVFILNENDRFEQINNVDIQCWELVKFDIPSEPGKQELLLTASDGVYEISNDVATRIFNARVGAIGNSPLYPDRLFIGMIGKIVSLSYSNGKWKKEGEFEMPQEEIRSIKPDNYGNLWIGTLYGGAFKLNAHDWQAYLEGKKENIDIDSYGLEEGLPLLNWNYFFHINNEVLLTTRKGIYRYNRFRDTFEKHPEIDKAFNHKERWVYYINKDEKGNLWFDSDQGKGMLVKDNGSYSLYENTFKRIIVSPENQVTGYTDKNGILWFGTPDGLFRYDSKYDREYKQSFDVLIRHVKVADDSVVFKGTYFTERADPADNKPRLLSSVQPSSLMPELKYDNNSVSFQFAATAFEHESGNLYAYKLDGYDDKWSAWTKETKKEYTNLREGQYTFRVKAKNFYDVTSDESAFNFSILPPWYRTPLAYIIYGFAGIGFMYLLVNGYSKKLKKDNLRLEAMVETRTAEINDQKEQIEKQKNDVERSYQNVTTLSQIGQNITSTLDLKSIINTLYKSINSLMDAASFGVGVYNEISKSLDFRYAYESGKELPYFSHAISDDSKMAIWCFNNRKEVFINNLSQEYTNYIQTLTTAPTAGKAHSESIIYIPLWIKDKMLGVITVQSFRKNAYQPFHLDILRTLAAYTAIALDNAYAYQRLNEINEELSSTLENLKQTQSQLVQSEKMASLGQLTAGVAHEINNPINFVSAGIDSLGTNYEDLSLIIKKYNQITPDADNSELFDEIERLKKELEMDYLLEEIPELLSSIKSGANRTTEIIKSLRNFTRLDEDQLKKADINEGLDSTLVILRNQMTNRIEVVREYGDLPPINCYPGQLNQVFMNILNNAIQAIDNEGRICIQTMQNDEYAIIKIKDSGKGMSKELQKRIFDPFFTTKDVGEGTGLGLSISYGIIEKHQGKIEVNSTAGEGTEFIIELPLNLN